MSGNATRQKSSRAMRGLLRVKHGEPGEVTLPAAGVATGGCIGLRGASADIGAPVSAVVLTGRVAAVAPGFLARGFRRFGIFCLRSQTRSVSTDMSTPSLASDCAISRIDAPPRRSVSNTSRYGSNSVNRRERGWRPSAINRASARALSVTGAGEVWSRAGEASEMLWSAAGLASVASWAWSGVCTVVSTVRHGGCSGAALACSGRPSVMVVGKSGCMRVIYPRPAGESTGAPRAPSKRKRLDVGVLPCCFVWYFWSRFSRLRLLRGSVPLVGTVALVMVGFDRWVEWRIRRSRCSVEWSLSPLGLSGGRSC